MTPKAGEHASPGRIEELESLRGIAAILVFLGHIPPWNPVLKDMPLISDSGVMVDLFFALSGFVICRAYGDALRRREDLLRFQWLRFGRLYPVHLIFLGAFLAVEIAKLVLSTTGLMTFQAAPFEGNGPRELLQHLLLIQAWSVEADCCTFNGPAWSISIEFYLYLIFGVIALVSGRWRVWVFLAIAVLGAGWLLTSPDNASVPRGLSGFFIGCLTAVFIARTKDRLVWPPMAQTAAFVGLFAYVLVMPGATSWLVGVTALTAFLIVTLVNGQNSAIKRILRTPLLTWLGSRSYAIYMSHMFVLYLASQAVLKLDAPLALMNGTLVYQLTLPFTVVMCLIIIVMVFAISEVTCRFIEQPCRAWSRRKAAIWFAASEQPGPAKSLTP